MTKKSLNKPKAETVVIKGTVTQNQKQVIQKLIGVLGSNEQDVIGKIIILWLYNEGFLKKTEGEE
jgi:RNA-binding protein YhbY